MPKQKLSEFQMKKCYGIHTNSQFSGDYLNFENKPKITNEYLFDKQLVAKIDDGSKRRMKRGLVHLNKTEQEVYDFVKEKSEKEGNKCNFYVEKFDKIISEYYLLIRVEDHKDVIYINKTGGINQLDPLQNAECIQIDITSENENTQIKLNGDFSENLLKEIRKCYNFFKDLHFTFLEVNPLGELENGEFLPVDFAAYIDDCALYTLSEEYVNILSMDYPLSESRKVYPCEENVRQLDLKTGSSLKLTILNPKGNIFTLVAGGGASVAYTDAIVNRGYLNNLVNYGEYSGDPPSEFVYSYTKEVLNCMKEIPDEKVLFIGGGIANFTDVEKTFVGLIKALEENVEILKTTKVYVRRGGPNVKKALEGMLNFSKKHNLSFEIHGPEKSITEVVSDALPQKDFERIIPENDSSWQEKLNKVENLKYISQDKENVNADFKISQNSKCMIYSYQPVAIQRMLDFDYVCGRESPSIEFAIDPRKTKDSLDKFFWGGDTILIPVYNNLELALKKHNTVELVVNFSSFRTAYSSTMELMEYTQLKCITIIAEGIPERFARIIQKTSSDKGILIIGPATVGGIKPGCLRIGNTCGSISNIIDSKLFRPGNVGFVTRSGGMLNELCNIISKTTNGVYQGISIGGDRHPGSQFIQHILNYEKDDNVKVIVLLGEVGGIQELYVANAVKDGIIKKPVVAWCMGTTADYLTEEIQFGHAGASSNEDYESAVFKNAYLKHCGINVPESFETVDSLIKQVYIENIEGTNKTSDKPPRELPENRKPITFFSSISNEIGEELMYNNVKVSDVSSIGKTIGHLWLKKDLPEWMCKYIELIIIVTADHGGMVSGAHNTIVASRAGKDLISSLCSGLLTIGDYFGGAINEAGNLFYHAHTSGSSAVDFVNKMNKEHRLISGIGHKIKTKDNPDKRVEILHNYLKENFHGDITKGVLNFALEVEKVTLKKRNNLILNVDGFIASSIIDCMLSVGIEEDEIGDMLGNGMLNGFFVLSRTIGFIGHFYDQKRLKQGLYRVDKSEIRYID